MSDGVQFTITTVEFQDGPYQGANVGEPIPTPVDPIDSTSDPTTEAGGGGGGGPLAWGPLGLAFRLGGSGRSALLLDPADVDLRQALKAGGSAAIATETDLADLAAIQGLYPLVAETTLRTGVIAFQLIVTAPAGEQVSADGITWGGTATFEASASTSLIQHPDAAASTDSSMAPIHLATTVQRRQSGFYRDTDVDVSASVPVQMINPALLWRTITGADAAAAGFDYATLAMSDIDAANPGLSDFALNGSGNNATWSNAIAIVAEPVSATGEGASQAAAVAASTLEAHAVSNSCSGSAGDTTGICAGVPSMAATSVSGAPFAGWQSNGDAGAVGPSPAQLEQLSSPTARARQMGAYSLKPVADNSSFVATVSAALGANAIGIATYDQWTCTFAGPDGNPVHVYTVRGSGFIVPTRVIYIVQYAVKADWP